MKSSSLSKPSNPVGYSEKLFLKKGSLLQYKCGLCHSIARMAEELSCEEHENDESYIYCLECLRSYLHSNNNECPIENTHQCSHHSIRVVRKQINAANIRCSNSVIALNSTIEQKEGDDTIEEGCQWEGIIRVEFEHQKNLFNDK